VSSLVIPAAANFEILCGKTQTDSCCNQQNSRSSRHAAADHRPPSTCRLRTHTHACTPIIVICLYL